MDDESIDTRLIEPMDEALHFWQFVVVEDGIERHVDADTKDVGIAAQRCDVFDAVAGSRSGAKGRTADIDGISTVVNGFAGYIEIFGRAEEFYGSHGEGESKRSKWLSMLWVGGGIGKGRCGR